MYALGIDIGSTTVKYVVCDENFTILHKAYIPHNTKQAETLLELLIELENKEPELFSNITQTFITGSGATRIAPTINARFVQEVNAVVLAVEHLHPDVNSVIELGGQDAKIIHFKEGKEGKKSVHTSMNDKCASGTGATIEKCTMKVGLEKEDIVKLHFSDKTLHHVAAKCGVFAETDIVNLVKTSVPSDEIMNSLADAIVMQNLTVLTRGNTLLPNVLLLGGPNTYLPFLQECWRLRISQLWDQREISYNKEELEKLIFAPKNAQFYAALGAVIFGQGENQAQEPFEGIEKLKALVNQGAISHEDVDTPLVASKEELEKFKQRYTIKPFNPTPPTEPLRCFLGIDGGSSSSKAVLVDQQGRLVLKVYQLSKGNPIQDTLEMLQKIKSFDSNNMLNIDGLGVTGYAADVLEGALKADANIIETIAHMHSAQHSFGKSVDVICDVGGQDIKVLFLENGMMKNFRLSNQCSAGNGALLQSMAKQFDVPIEKFADTAFEATQAPKFNYGCAVFLDTDRVNFQKEGYTKEELFAGISKVLPKNIWQYVVQAPDISQLGSHFVLQGGTQYNQAALKAQVDYILSQAPDARVDVHPHPGEAGAIGAALEALRVVTQKGKSSFVGLDDALGMEYTTTTNEETRCRFCSINCSRTFIDTQTPSGNKARYIAGFACEEGTVESAEALRELKKERQSMQEKTPNLVKLESKKLFAPLYQTAPKPSQNHYTTKLQTKQLFGKWGPRYTKKIVSNFAHSSSVDLEYRKGLKIALPRVLNLYSLAPFFRAYLEALDIPSTQILFSHETNEDMYLEGAKFGSVDSCYPAKVAQSHIYQLLFDKRFKRQSLDFIWFPAITHLDSYISHSLGSTACPIVSGTPSVVKSAFKKERDLFELNAITYIDSALDFTNQALLKAQLFETWHEQLRITKDESDFACDEALKALKSYDDLIQTQGERLLSEAVENNEVLLLLLGRPYHTDPGLNHEILDEFQALGFKTLSMRSIPKSKSFIESLFQNDIDKGIIADPFDISDVWPENYSANSSQKVWAAKFAARHPNVAVVDLSSFKCGHDAPTYAIINKILGHSQTPHLMLHDIDANKPGGSIKIRVKTFAYALKQYQEQLAQRSHS